MKIKLLFATLLFVFATASVAASETDYLARMAMESEIKTIAVVANVKKMSCNADGTFTRVTFKRVHAVSSFTPKTFVGACKVMDYRWQKRRPGTVYFKPRKGQKVYVTITTNGGAITSYTLLTPQLEAVIKKSPERLAYSKGRASILPHDE
ncbi:hypothetical protein [uncultured Pseudodesulfovibrio sp.]|uniref:hypothetical protein n=1 Tax=uncultured Pseudodesulfovibrio sp. TaxID=2035858 RepID=UPI0029C6E33C|nr:hypothetical protein [uncultured Pseudodesulfovibrio sp.]